MDTTGVAPASPSLRLRNIARTLLDVGCGLRAAAHALLPNLPTLSYVGLDADPPRLAEAVKLIFDMAFRERVELERGPLERRSG